MGVEGGGLGRVVPQVTVPASLARAGYGHEHLPQGTLKASETADMRAPIGAGRVQAVVSRALQLVRQMFYHLLYTLTVGYISRHKRR